MCGGAEPFGVLEVTAWTQADGLCLTQCGTSGGAAQDGRHGELGERGLGISEAFVGVDGVVLDDALATKQPSSSLTKLGSGAAKPCSMAA
jgi:hypothetical protein